MDKIISAEGQRKQRERRIADLDVDTLLGIVEAADAFAVAGLCDNNGHAEVLVLLDRLRAAGLADS